MRRTLFVAMSALICLLLLSSCVESKSNVPFDGILDSDSGNVYKLGDPKSKFDDAFGQAELSKYSSSYEYLSGILSVKFDDAGQAIEIESSGKSNRFEFYNFTFEKPLKEIEGRYESSETAGFTFYSIYYDENGKSCDFLDSSYIATLMVRDGDMELMDLKDGEYVSYYIKKTKIS